MDANLEITRMRQEIIESINQHSMPIAVVVLLLKEILAEAQVQLNSALSDAVKKEKEEKEERDEKLAAICRESRERCEKVARKTNPCELTVGYDSDNAEDSKTIA